MPGSSTSAALNNFDFSFARGGWGENFVSPVSGQVMGEGGCHQGTEGVTKSQYSGFLSFSSLNLGNNFNAGEASSSSSLGPLNAEFNANQGEAAGSIPFSELGIGNNVNQGQTTGVFSVSRLVLSNNANPGQAAGSFSFTLHAVGETDCPGDASGCSDGSPSKYLDLSSYVTTD